MRRLGDILSDGSASLEALLKEAFDAGKAEAAAEMRAKMAVVIDNVSGGSTDTPPHEASSKAAKLLASVPTQVSEGRATPGTVKPHIISLISQAGSNGISTDELISVTGFKPNSVRGTVSTLQIENTIRRVGNRWVSAAQPPTEAEK
jgi:hypothetical protein